ncbi:MAG TPA: fumarylacetoacetate hydrolase family protein [Phycisphaerae bacterium]|nr:fumarylacetoacetate hydrolase family protein [Phycisphaerae bacterium]
MKIAKIKFDGKTSYAKVEDNGYNLIGDKIFGQYAATGTIIPFDKAKLLVPVEPWQIIAIGLNYRQHAIECNMQFPKAPVVFIKTPNTITGPGSDIILPKMAPDCVDYEAELAIIIGRQAKNVTENEAGDYILGYTCSNDVSARDCQLKQDVQWARGKCFDTFAPIGPYIVTGLNGDNLDIKLTLNGQVMQQSNTSDLIFSCKTLVSYISRCMTLYPGSIIMTGTPSGVGMGRNPQVYMKHGDKVCVEIEGIGCLENTVVTEA